MVKHLEWKWIKYVFVYNTFGMEIHRLEMNGNGLHCFKLFGIEMDGIVSNHLEEKFLTLFTILEIVHVGHLEHSKWSKWPEMGVPNWPFIK